MIFEQVPIGGDKNFGYLVGDAETREVAVVDPGMDPQALLDRADEAEAKITWILATHSHRDHIASVGTIQKATGARFAAHPDVPGVEHHLADGEEFSLGSVHFRAIYCPGHCADSIVYLIDGTKALVGDELFVGGVGRTHSEAQARQHYHSLHHTLLTLGDQVEIYPGHDYGSAPHSTLGHQRATNPFLLQPTFDAFWHLRQHWKEYCRKHRIVFG